MYLNQLHLLNFRSFEDSFFDLKDTNLVYGENGCGKTSFLEAIHFSLKSKSFRTSSVNSMINKKNTVVFGISKDSIESHLKFKKKYKLKFDLLSDEKLSVIKKYGAWGMKSFLGKKYKGVIRSTFLINSKGKIHKIWSNVRVKDHAKSVVDELKNII